MFTLYGFFSISTIGARATGKVAVRARNKAHLENLQKRFPVALGKCKIFGTPTRDYAYRFDVSKDIWAHVVKEMAAEQSWDNFKEACANQEKAGALDTQYVDVLHAVWGSMSAYQRKAAEPKQNLLHWWKETAEKHAAIDDELGRKKGQRCGCAACRTARQFGGQ